MFAQLARRAVVSSKANSMMQSGRGSRFYADAATVITLNLTTPHKTILKEKQATLVTVTGSGGVFGIAPDHVPTVAELKPGLVTVTTSQGEENYFVSGGFAFVHANSTVDLSVIEAVPLDQLDPARVKSGLDSYAKKLASATQEVESAKAQIGLEVHEAMAYALTHVKSS